LGKILEVGFKLAGQWTLAGGELKLQLDPDWKPRAKVLYAFTVSGELAYIGKTVKSLGSRLQQYKTPPKTAENGATTNRKNSRLIKEAIKEGKQVEVYAYASVTNHQIGAFRLDHAAGLEDDLIAQLQPPWNGRQPQGSYLLPKPAKAKLAPAAARAGTKMPEGDGEQELTRNRLMHKSKLRSETEVINEILFGGYLLRKLESRTIEVEREGTPIIPAKPVLRNLAGLLNVSILNSNGNPFNTRQLGDLLIRTVAAQQDESL
jgi:hypothetical protein